ncbi:hypothetical protein SLEP1_g14696 [Rubroshorea leprosula]|uniref:Uncharacterized protein n=1 Tax=Rubroshorea leprosula TaxID=152421 RepID=A0AAV5ISU7_9ROSI|nr:hypothetical protein SLEP1_g14696 [Rubroshorea leprosula]
MLACCKFNKEHSIFYLLSLSHSFSLSTISGSETQCMGSPEE